MNDNEQPVDDPLTKAKKLQAGAWSVVIANARKWAMLDAHSRYVNEHGSMINVPRCDVKDLLSIMHQDLERSIRNAYIEDSLVGQEIYNTATV